MSATSTEALATDPVFNVATSTEGTGSKIGGSIFTGSALASTTVKNILNITRSSIDGPGKTNSSHLTATTENEGTITTSDDTRATTGDNNGLGGEGDATIRTGGATAHAQVVNVVNTNFFNSVGQVLFLNPDNGDSLDLRTFDLSYFTTGHVGASPTQLGCTILTCLNSSALSVLNKNEGTVNNDVFVRAATGGNSATSTKGGGVDIATGNAYASADVLNMVNTNFINSKYLVATFDNFGNMQGDIVLPDATFFNKLFANGNTLPDLNSSSFVAQNDNNEAFMGTTTANALTGGNVATSTDLGHGDAQTGVAHSFSNSFTSANQTKVGGSSALFVFHVAGSWNGSVKGLPAGMSWRRTDYGVEVYSNGSMNPEGTQGVYNSSDFIASSTNKAIVNTNVDVWAETGGNTAFTGDGTGHIATGDAYASANVVNMVNTNIVNRNFLFVVFNIAGDWQGDIDFGGHSPNLAVTTTTDAPPSISPGSNVTYRFLVRNSGDVAANNVLLATAYDKNIILYQRGNAPSSDTTVGTNWNLGSLAPGESREVDATVRILAPGLPAGISISAPLIAQVTSDARDQDDSDNTQKTFITITAPGVASSGGGTGTTGRDRGGTASGADTSNGGGSGSPSTGSGQGGGSSPSGGGGGGGPPATSSSPASGGGGSSGSAPAGGSSGDSSNSGGGGAAASSAGGGGGGGGASLGYGTQGGLPASAITPDPDIVSVKTSNIGTTTAPATVNYKVVVKNKKGAGPLYKGVLTDTLNDPSGGIVYTRAWDLDVVAPGDELTLTYSVAFASTTKPGMYHNIARVTGYRANASPLFGGNPITPIDATETVVFLSNGLVLGDSTSTIGVVSSDLQVAKYACSPLIENALKPGSSNTPDVVKLQTFLNNTQGSNLPTTGFFGPLTTMAVKSFQLTYAADILAPVGLKAPTGFVYSSTLRKINTLACGGVDPTVSGPAPSAPVPLKGPSAPAKPKVSAKPRVKNEVAKSGLLGTIGKWFSWSH